MKKITEKRELEILENLEKDSEWITVHYDELRKHENKVVAVRNRKIIFVSENLEELLTELEDRKENTAFVLIAAIPPKDASFIL